MVRVAAAAEEDSPEDDPTFLGDVFYSGSSVLVLKPFRLMFDKVLFVYARPCSTPSQAQPQPSPHTDALQAVAQMEPAGPQSRKVALSPTVHLSVRPIPFAD